MQQPSKQGQWPPHLEGVETAPERCLSKVLGLHDSPPFLNPHTGDWTSQVAPESVVFFGGCFWFRFHENFMSDYKNTLNPMTCLLAGP